MNGRRGRRSSRIACRGCVDEKEEEGNAETQANLGVEPGQLVDIVHTDTGWCVYGLVRAARLSLQLRQILLMPTDITLHDHVNEAKGLFG